MHKKIKILHIQLLPLLSGVQNMMLRLLSSLPTDVYDISVACKSNGPLIAELKKRNIKWYNVKHLVHPISIKNDVLAFYEIYSIIKHNNFDIVHTHSSKTGFLGRIAAKLAGVKKIFHTVHGFAFHPYQKTHTQLIYKFAEKIATSCCDKVIFVNSYERKLAIKLKLMPAKKACTIYNGIKLNPYPKNLNSNKFVVGSVLRFDLQKNIINTIKVAINVCKQNPNIYFEFIGDGKFYKKCKLMVKNANLQNNISLPGWSNDINKKLATFNVFLLYSKWEGLPLSILEAMASKLAIIASNIKGNNELVINNVNGILVNPNINKHLQKVILDIYNNPKRLNSMQEESLKLINKKFSFQNFALSYKRLYESNTKY